MPAAEEAPNQRGSEKLEVTATIPSGILVYIVFGTEIETRTATKKASMRCGENRVKREFSVTLTTMQIDFALHFTLGLHSGQRTRRSHLALSCANIRGSRYMLQMIGLNNSFLASDRAIKLVIIRNDIS
jgi:hypothetical protein